MTAASASAIPDLRAAYRALLDAARTTTPETSGAPDGEWNTDQILAHVSLVTAGTLATLTAISAGTHAIYDNRISQDTWTINHVLELADGARTAVRDRIRVQADALCALAESTLSDAELNTPVPTRLLSHNAVLVDQPVALRDIIAGLATTEIPGHTAQLLALRAPA